MPLPKLVGKERELYLAGRVRELQLIYRATQERLSTKLRRITLTEFDRNRTERILKEVKVQIAALNLTSKKWTERTIPVAYFEGVDVAAEAIKRFQIARRVNYDAQIHTAAVNVLTDEVTSALLIANGSIQKNVERFIRQTQQRILEDREISRMIAEGTITGEARRQTSDRLLNAFRENMADEKYIVINGRNFRPDSYAELVARTRTREASSRGIVNTALKYNMDLVLVSDHDTETELCQKYEGKIFSISGNSKGYKVLDLLPPFHPNCKHVISPITEEYAEEKAS